jgi:hypothetical protein
MKNKLTDLNDILFAQLERLTNEDLSQEQITAEVQRTTSVVQVADRIVDTARLQLDGAKFMTDQGGKPRTLPASLALPERTEAGK